MRVNFDLIDKYPHYVFNWTGANRYRLMKEYFPNDYARMKQYVAQGRWFPAGSSMEEGDVNLPNAEGIIRQILYGNTYFRKEFGKASEEYMLPDCFGFPASLPSILAHAGIKGFSTQKLSAAWQPAPRVGGPDSPEQTPEGIPFNVGMWEGTDGKTIIAALNPGGYGSSSQHRSQQGTAATAARRSERAGRTRARRARTAGAGLGQAHRSRWQSDRRLRRLSLRRHRRYRRRGFGREREAARSHGHEGHGVAADLRRTRRTRARADRPSRLRRRIRPVAMGEGPVHVVISAADQMFKDIKPEMTRGCRSIRATWS